MVPEPPVTNLEIKVGGGEGGGGGNGGLFTEAIVLYLVLYLGSKNIQP
jgi:hypothetical protein